jgi:hypothetical protein
MSKPFNSTDSSCKPAGIVVELYFRKQGLLLAPYLVASSISVDKMPKMRLIESSGELREDRTGLDWVLDFRADLHVELLKGRDILTLVGERISMLL